MSFRFRKRIRLGSSSLLVLLFLKKFDKFPNKFLGYLFVRFALLWVFKAPHNVLRESEQWQKRVLVKDCKLISERLKVHKDDTQPSACRGIIGWIDVLDDILLEELPTDGSATVDHVGSLSWRS